MKPLYKLEDLADSIVPERIKNESPQFFELIKAFLTNLEQVQSSINDNFLDTIDYNKVINEDYKKLFLDTYLKTIDIKNEDNLLSAGELLKVSKNLSVIKGTEFLYRVLVRLLLLIVPGIGTQYNTLLEEFNTTTDPIRKQELEVEILNLESQNYDEGFIEVDEVFNNGEIVPFTYRVLADLDVIFYDRYIKKFAHISGWEETFIRSVKTIAEEILDTYDSFTVFDAFNYPLVPLDGSFNLVTSSFPDDIIDPANFESNFTFPFTFPFPFTESLSSVVDVNVLKSKVIDPFSIFQIGDIIYYNWDKFNDPETFITEGTHTIIKSPVKDDIIPTAGGYLSDTTNTGTMNGSLSAGSLKLAHKIIHQDFIKKT